MKIFRFIRIKYLSLMITITNEFSSAGRNFGNKLFTYGVSRLIAEEYGYKLVIPKNSHIQRNGIHIEFPYKGIDGIEIQEPTYYVSDGSMVERGFEYILKECKDKKITPEVVYGFFPPSDNFLTIYSLVHPKRLARDLPLL